SCSATPALLRSGQREPQSGVDALIRELEAALIPVNRAAARRALSRLHRETARAAGSVVVESRVERPRQSQLPPKLSVKPPPVENVREPMRRVVRVPGGLSTEERPAVATEIVAEPTEPPPRVVAPVLPVQKPPTPPPPPAPYPEPPSLIPPEVSIPLRFDQVCHEPVTRPEPVVVRATIRRTLP